MARTRTKEQSDSRSLKERVTSTRAWKLVSATLAEWRDDKVARLAAALTYYTIFSLPPLLLLLLSVAGLVVDRAAVQDALVGQVGGLVGEGGSGMVKVMLESMQASTGRGWVGAVIGGVTLLLGATGAVAQLQDALNTIWEIEKPPSHGILGMVKDRILSFSMILVLAFMLVASLGVSAGLAAVNEYLGAIVPAVVPMAWLLDLVLSLAVTTAIFALIFKYLPDVVIPWRDVWVGAFVTAALFAIGKYALGFYLANSNTASTYGAAGSLILILLWLYYSAQILLLGAEFTQVYSRQMGSRIAAAGDAQRLEGLPSEQRATPKGDASRDSSRDRQARQAKPERGARPGLRTPARSRPPRSREIEDALPPEAVTVTKEKESHGGGASDVWRFVGVIAGTVLAAVGLGKARSRNAKTKRRTARRRR